MICVISLVLVRPRWPWPLAEVETSARHTMMMTQTQTEVRLNAEQHYVRDRGIEKGDKAGELEAKGEGLIDHQSNSSINNVVDIEPPRQPIQQRQRT